MPLKLQLTQSEYDALPDALRSEYAAVDGQAGTFRLSLDTDPDASVREFRANNIALRQQNETLTGQIAQLTTSIADLQSRYSGIDPAEVARLREQASAAARAAGGAGNESLDQVVARVSALSGQIETLQSQLTQRDAQLVERDARIEETQLEAGLRQLAQRHGVSTKGSALTVAIGMLKPKFTRGEDGAPTFKPGLFDPATGNSLTVDGEFAALRDREPYLFEGTSGAPADPAGARRGPTPVNGVLVNPDAATFARHSEAIAKGEVTVQYTEQ